MNVFNLNFILSKIFFYILILYIMNSAPSEGVTGSVKSIQSWLFTPQKFAGVNLMRLWWIVIAVVLVGLLTGGISFGVTSGAVQQGVEAAEEGFSNPKDLKNLPNKLKAFLMKLFGKKEGYKQGSRREKFRAARRAARK